MDKSLRNKLMKIKNEKGQSCVNFFNDGSVSRDDYENTKKMEWAKSDAYFSDIESQFVNIVVEHTRNTDFDSIDMHMLMGLVFNKDDVDEENVIKENAKPINNMVRYRVGNIDSVLDGEQTDITYLNRYSFGKEGYLRYNEFVRTMRRAGINFIGPRNFNEFKEASMSNEAFDICLIAQLMEKQNNSRLIRKMK